MACGVACSVARPPRLRSQPSTLLPSPFSDRWEVRHWQDNSCVLVDSGLALEVVSQPVATPGFDSTTLSSLMKLLVPPWHYFDGCPSPAALGTTKDIRQAYAAGLQKSMDGIMARYLASENHVAMHARNVYDHLIRRCVPTCTLPARTAAPCQCLPQCSFRQPTAAPPCLTTGTLISCCCSLDNNGMTALDRLDVHNNIIGYPEVRLPETRTNGKGYSMSANAPCRMFSWAQSQTAQAERRAQQEPGHPRCQRDGPEVNAKVGRLRSAMAELEQACVAGDHDGAEARLNRVLYIMPGTVPPFLEYNRAASDEYCRLMERCVWRTAMECREAEELLTRLFEPHAFT